MNPTIGRIVHYTLTEQDAQQINKRRADSQAHIHEHRENSNGVQIHFGNSVQAGDVYPLVITRVWGPGETAAFNGQVLLDGNDCLWVTSTSIGEGPRKCAWPTRSA